MDGPHFAPHIRQDGNFELGKLIFRLLESLCSLGYIYLTGKGRTFRPKSTMQISYLGYKGGPVERTLFHKNFQFPKITKNAG